MADSIRGTVAAAKDAVAASETLMRILLLGKTLWDQKSGESPDVPVGQELNLFQRSLEDNIQVLNSKTVGLGNSAVWALGTVDVLTPCSKICLSSLCLQLSGHREKRLCSSEGKSQNDGLAMDPCEHMHGVGWGSASGCSRVWLMDERMDS